jgi:Flp pilus assembly secretin CpaC
MKSLFSAFARRAVIAAVAVCAGAAMGNCAPAGMGKVVDLTIDFATVLKLDRPAKTIVIGNPGIADASVQDGTTVVLTGKAAGTTNMIILDDKGAEVANETLRVASNLRQLTTVFYGSKRQTYSCAPTCEQVIVVGDDPTAFQTAAQQILGRAQFTNAP